MNKVFHLSKVRKISNVNFFPSLYTHNGYITHTKTGEILTEDSMTNIAEYMAYCWEQNWFPNIPRRFLKFHIK